MKYLSHLWKKCKSAKIKRYFIRLYYGMAVFLLQKAEAFPSALYFKAFRKRFHPVIGILLSQA